MQAKKETQWVVLVPGIYMPGFSMSLLARRLRQAGFQARIFSYPSLRLSVAENAARLYETALLLDAPVLHFVGHSLGGLVIRTLLATQHTALPAGNTVTLGTPHTGSKVARHMQAQGLGWLLGRSRTNGLLGNIPAWPTERALGSLAGRSHYGVGRLLAPLDWPHDGTVEVAETLCANATDRMTLPINHTTLLTDKLSAYQTVYFLRQQHFDHSRPC